MTQTAVERLLAAARAETGYLGKATNSQLDSKTANPGSNNYTKYARDLDALGVYNGRKNGYAWCDMFVDWCFIQTFGLAQGMAMTFQPMGGYGAGCTNSAAYYRQKGRFYKDKPQPGDQISLVKMAAEPCATPGWWKRWPPAGSIRSRATPPAAPAWWLTAAWSGLNPIR